MATTQLSDVIQQQYWTNEFINGSPELTAFFNSGIVVMDPELSRLASANNGGTFTVPFFNDLATTEPNIGTDNPATLSTPQKIDQAAEKAIKHIRNQSWSTMDLTSALGTGDPAAAIRSLVGQYWLRQRQRMLTSSAVGVIADNVANDSGDMVYDATGETVKTITGEYVIQAAQTMGDAKSSLAAIAMHSVVYTNLQKQNLIQYLRDTDTNAVIETYLSYRVIVDDNMPVEIDGGGSGIHYYTSILFGAGAFGWGDGSPTTPVEVDRNSAAGNGEGEEILYVRQHNVLHPRGFAFTESSMASTSPTNTELQDADNWNRVYADRKQIRMAALITTG